jgi:hypothetical protein
MTRALAPFAATSSRSHRRTVDPGRPRGRRRPPATRVTGALATARIAVAGVVAALGLLIA